MIDTEFNVRRYISEFLGKTEELISEYELESFELKKFQMEFGVSNSEDPMFACYPIKERNIKFLKFYLAKEPEWDFLNKFYFVEACAI